MVEIADITVDLENFEISDSLICSPEQCTKYINSNPRSITVFHVNVRSVNCNFDSVVVILQRIDIKCDLIVLTECWLKKTNDCPYLEGYTSFKSNHRNQNDGVIIYTRTNLD